MFGIFVPQHPIRLWAVTPAVCSQPLKAADGKGRKSAITLFKKVAQFSVVTIPTKEKVPQLKSVKL